MGLQVDLVLFGHVHNYERTCAVYKNQCKAMPRKDGNGTDTYDNTKYSAPVHAVIGMAGFSLDDFSTNVSSYNLIETLHCRLKYQTRLHSQFFSTLEFSLSTLVASFMQLLKDDLRRNSCLGT